MSKTFINLSLFLFMFVWLNNGIFLNLGKYKVKDTGSNFYFYKDSDCIRFCTPDLIIPATSILKIQYPIFIK